MKKIILAFSVLLALILSLSLYSCKKNSLEDFRINPEFQKYITSFTSGVVSSKSAIIIQFAQPFKGTFEPNKEVKDKLFSFSPSIKGKTVWVDEYTVQFIPENKLKSGQTYWVDFDLDKVTEVPKDLKTFKFPITIIKQAINFESAGLKVYENESYDYYQYQGIVYSADVVTTKELNEYFNFQVNGKTVKVKWNDSGNHKKYNLILDSVPRLNQEGILEAEWNIYPIDKKDKKTITEDIPAKGSYRILSSTVVQHPEQHVIVRFSDPLSKSQNLSGLVEIQKDIESKTSISTNELFIYPNYRIEGWYTVFVDKSIQNTEGKKLKEDYSDKVHFQAIKPAVKLVGNGAILPSSNQMLVPFEAVNLKAVDIRIIKIFESNIKQFFQLNDYNGEEELIRVGRVIRKKTLYLDKDKPLDLTKWNRFNLDLSEYIKVEQGAIYRVEIGFRKYQSLYPCTGGVQEDFDMDETDWDEDETAEKGEWDYVGDWYYNYDYYYEDWFDGYDYSLRDDPCSYSYYRNVKVTKNIFASDIGIISKGGTNGEYMVIINDIITSKPIEGASVEFYDLQQQLLATVKTDKDGIAKTKALKFTPFFIIAKHNNTKGYLRLVEDNALSISHFDVDGDYIMGGIKGFIYGERGVWRPGDTLFLNFILEDKEKILPDNHPVIFELFNSREQLVKRDVKTTSLNGFYNFTTPTEADAPTGNWSVRIKVGNAEFYKNIKVETIKPNRLKINLDFNKEVLDASTRFIKGKLSVNWLHGSPARNLKTDISLRFKPIQTQFKDFKNYHFDDPSKDFWSEDEVFLEKNLDDNGVLQFDKAVELNNSPAGMLRAIFTTRAFENGGDFSISQSSINYAPYDHFIGIKTPEPNAYGALETDKDYKFPLITVDANGKRAGNRNLRVKIYRIEWSWWWESGSNNAANYINNYNVSPISTQTISTNAQGEGVTSLKINKYDWGRYLIKVEDIESGHSTGILTYFDWPSWMSRAGRATPEGANILTFAADKKEYNTGEKARISFPSSKEGNALISIENGRKVIDAFWMKTEEGETSFELPITGDLAPNCFVHITLLQPHKNTLNDAPIRMYGIIPILVKDPTTVLEPIIKMPNELTPETSFNLEVTEKNKHDMTYTIAIVDEGLLDLTNFKTPDPWNRFYAREALGVKTWDLYDYVIGAYGAKIENILTIGGDENINPGEKNPLRFKPMVKFIGPFYLKGGKTAQHKIHIPNYIGSVRTMVIAGQQGAYGNAEKTTPVKKPLMVLATLPRVLSPKETVTLPVNVFAMDKKVKNVNIQVKTNSLVKVAGSSSKQINFTKEGDQLVNFELEVGSKSGAASIEVVATSGSEKSTYTVDIEIRQPNLPISYVKEATVEGKSSWEEEVALTGLENTNSAKLELSTIPPINLEKRLGYLLQYPHGCIEQKTSGAFPQLYLSSLIKIDDETKKRIDNNIQSVINKIQKHQISNGGFSFWEGGSYADDWGTTYAGHFMLEAEKRGYALPYGLKDKWKSFQKEIAKDWKSTDKYGYRNSDLMQAYRLYTLALAGDPLLSAMNKLRAQDNLSVAASWRLAAAYQIAGKTNIAKEIIRDKSTKIAPYTELSYSYGNNYRDEAMIIETLTLLGEKTKASALVKDLSEALSTDNWMSTQTTAYSLMAIAKFTENNQPKGGMNATIFYNGKTTTINSRKAIEIIDLKVMGNQNAVNFKVNNNNDEYLFARLVTTGVPLPGNEIPFNNNLKMNVVYKNNAGKPINVEQIEQGMDFSVEVTVSNPGMHGDYHDLALSQLFPSGWEIQNQRMDIGYDGDNDALFDYQDIRDDRVFTYFSLARNKSKVITIYLHATYAGEYYLPAVYIEAMYDNSISALEKGKKVKVKYVQ
ncbi:MAG: MG2 domain-containing protein [Brumimicrobium sp.]|nr:MG2 domain-containing protein [Brumimicrobium sp.]